MEKKNKIHGFSLVESRQLPELDGVCHELCHDRTGLKLLWIDRDEENKTFGIAFETLPQDDTGVFHILEHSVLCGSSRYPVKEPFVELMKHSMNTFLNAMTFPDKTFYPVSTRSEKELVNLMRVYLDAVFHPLIDSRPEIFCQEGWHYAFEADGAIRYTGVVYNEMKGAFASADQQLSAAMNRTLFPDTPYRFVSGGDPRHIPELTYEKFLEYHRNCYHPSNGYVFLDGKMDLDAVLKIIEEEYLSGFDRGQRWAPPALQAPVNGGRQEIRYELAPGEALSGHTRMGWGFVIGTFDQREKQMALQVLAKVLCGSHQAPLSKAVLSRHLAQDVSMQVMDGIAQPWLLLDVKNLDASDENAVRECVFDTLKQLAESGLDKEQLAAAMSNLEFKLREKDYGYMPEGLVLGFSVLESWLYGGDPTANLEIGDLFDRLRQKAEEGYFEELIRQVLLENPHACQVTMQPSHTLGDERRREEQQRLEAACSRWSDGEKEEYRNLQAHLEEWQKQEDLPEALARLPRLSIGDIPRTPERIPTDTDLVRGIPVLKHHVSAHGIAYVTLYFDAGGFGPNELPQLSLLCILIGKLKTQGKSGEEIIRRTQRLCGNLNVYLSAFQPQDQTSQCVVKLCVTFSTLEEHVRAAAEHVAELLTKTCFEEESVMLDLLRQYKNQMYQQIVMAGSTFGMGRIFAQTSTAGAVSDVTSGIGFYQWLCRAEEKFDGSQLPLQLSALAKQVFHRSGLTVSYTCAREDRLDELAAVFAEELPVLEGFVPVLASLKPYGLRKEGIIIAADVAFAVRGANLAAFGQTYTGTLALAARTITLNYLWNEIRVQGGAYGTGLSVGVSGLTCCYSYRDPNGIRSLEKYTEAAGFLKTFCEKKPDLTGLIVGAVSDASPLLTSRSKGLTADRDYWGRITWEDRCRWREELLQATPQSLAGLADGMEKIMAQGGICLIGSRKQVEACENLDVKMTL